MTTQTQSEKDRVVIFDTTLRDGEQCPGATMTHEEKLEVAELLDEMGVDIIEAGFPIASEGDFAAVQEISKRTKNAVVCGLSRASFKDIDRAAEAIKPARRGRIHTFISTSPVHMKWKLQMEPEKVFELVIAQVTRARNYTDDVEWSCEDGTRTEHDFLCRCVEAAINAGATTINIPDTVGYTVPDEYAAIFKMVRERVPNSDKARFSVHCHDDLGMAVANSLAGQRLAGRGRDGDAGAQRRAAVLDRHRGDHADPRLQAGLRGDVVSGAVQQGDRRAERVRSRIRHPSGRHAQAYPDL
jgi:2-isopropylmalate synthase